MKKNLTLHVFKSLLLKNLLKPKFFIYFLLALSLQIFAGNANGQNTKVSGKITGPNDDPLQGVSVREKGTSNGTTTDNNGNFSLTVGNNAVLQVSSVGFEDREVPVGDQSNITLKLVPTAQQLEQVVVIGYGTQKRKDITSAISTVNTKDVSVRPIVNTAEVIAGKAPGVQVFQPSGRPGSDFSIRIRGVASVIGSSQPIYVVDGVITYDTKGLDPSNIESINILKDASAAGIYGAAGSTNGVVLITTKKGARGRSKVELNTYTGFQEIVKKLDMLNSQQYLDLITQEKENAGTSFSYDPALKNIYTDWQDVVYRKAQMTGVNAGFSSGSEKGTIYMGLGYLNQEGVINMSNFVRYSAKLNIEQTMNNWLTIGSHLNYNRTNSRDVPDNSRVNQGGVVLGALSTPPVVEKYNADGTFGLNPFQAWENPLASIEGPYNKNIANNTLGDVFAEFKLPANLKFRSMIGISLNNYNYEYFLDPFRTQYGRSQTGIAENDFGEKFRYNWDNTLTFDKLFNEHSVNVIIGSSAQEEKETNSRQYGEGFATAYVTTVNAATKSKQVSQYKQEWSLASYFARVNYGYNDKYLFTASIRADGSSRFGSENRWGYFPAFSAGWRVSKEGFMQDVTTINDLKIRAGWGTTGNLPPTYYPSVSRLATWPAYSFGADNLPGVIPDQEVANPELKWEDTRQFNAGFDLSLFSSRLTFTTDLYLKKTHNLIFRQDLPLATGFGYRYANAPGYVQNKGIEFNLTGTVLSKKDFSWNASFNLSYNKSIVKDLDSGTIFYFGSIPERDYSVVLKEDLPLGAFWGFVSEGVDPQTGNIIFRDLNGDGVIDPDNDRTFLGSAMPKVIYGFTTDLTYKNFGINLLFDGVSGNKVMNATRIETEGMFDVKNSSAATLNRWIRTGQVTDIPKAVFGDPDQNTRISSRFIEDGSFFRLRNLTLFYSFNKDWLGKIGMTGLRIYVTAQNLFTITDYKGYYPEVNRDNADPVSQGIDYGTYPKAKVYTIGLNLEL